MPTDRIADALRAIDHPRSLDPDLVEDLRLQLITRAEQTVIRSTASTSTDQRINDAPRTYVAIPSPTSRRRGWVIAIAAVVVVTGITVAVTRQDDVTRVLDVTVTDPSVVATQAPTPTSSASRTTASSPTLSILSEIALPELVAPNNFGLWFAAGRLWLTGAAESTYVIDPDTGETVEADLISGYWFWPPVLEVDDHVVMSAAVTPNGADIPNWDGQTLRRTDLVTGTTVLVSLEVPVGLVGYWVYDGGSIWVNRGHGPDDTEPLLRFDARSGALLASYATAPYSNFQPQFAYGDWLWGTADRTNDQGGVVDTVVVSFDMITGRIGEPLSASGIVGPTPGRRIDADDATRWLGRGRDGDRQTLRFSLETNELTAVDLGDCDPLGFGEDADDATWFYCANGEIARLDDVTGVLTTYQTREQLYVPLSFRNQVWLVASDGASRVLRRIA